MTDPGRGASAVGDGDQIASLAQRAMARSVDLMVVAVVSLALFAPQLILKGAEARVPRWTQVAVFVLWLAYEAGTTAVLGQTMGKLATGCRVADRQTGCRPGFARSIVRAAVIPGLLPFLAIFGLIGYATAILDPQEYRGLLDRLAGTVVVRAVSGERR